MPESLGRLRRVRRIGVGGFASVWLYRDEQLDSYVAVKALADNWAQQIDVRERFLEEARVLRRAASDHVVEVHDFGETEDGTPYFVMTYADRGTIAELLHAGPVDPHTSVDLLEQACRGVADLHAAGVVHRDIKPPNLLLRSDRSRGQRLLVADLGLAKALMYASGLTQIVGTPAYMAPEQGVPGGGVDERADVHALGAVAYHLLTGRPMRHVAIADVGSAVAPTPPHQVAAVSPGLSDVVVRAVRPDPADRWPSATAFGAALREAVGTRIEPPTDTIATSPPPATPPRTRRRAMVALVAAIALVAAAGLALLALREDGDPTADDTAASESPETSTTGSPSVSAPSGEPTATLDGVAPADREYCTKVVGAWATLPLINTGSPSLPQIGVAIDTIHQITRLAPRGEVVDAWRLIDRPFQDFQAAVDATGLTWEDLGAERLGSPEQRAALLSAVETFRDDMNGLDPNRVGGVIEPDAEARCDVDLDAVT